MKLRKYFKINTPKELSKQLGVSLDRISRVVLNLSDNFVFREKIKDKKGKERDFYEAKGDLKIIHNKIDKNLLNRIYYPETMQGGIKGRSIKSNAKFHTGKRYVANFDIAKFFPSVSNRVVYRTFINKKCAPDVASQLTKLTTVNGQLPQGFKTSPKISGLVLRNIDERLSILLKPLNLIHTFWIDDLTISGNYPIAKLKRIVEKIFRQGGFKLNANKTYIANRKQQQICTGLTVNCGINPSKEFRKKLRRELYICKKFGVKNYLEKNNIVMDMKSYIWSLKGRVNFLISINHDYKKYKEIVEKLKYERWFVKFC